jgi:3-hydroxybutyryl-CoA dehydrogenase
MPRRESNALALRLRIPAGSGLAEITEVCDAFGRLDASAAFDRTIEHVDLVIESAPESIDLKQKLFTHRDAIAGRSAVLASNTSGLSITAIASRCRHPERVLTTHSGARRI